MTHLIAARLPAHPGAPRFETDPGIVAAYLGDAAHVGGGHAPSVAVPATEGEVAAVLAQATRVLPVGAQSSLTGGATPRGEVVLSTRNLGGTERVRDGAVRVGAGVVLADLQRTLADAGLYYPPVPTYDGAFVGGTIATNAAGAATFKYGATRAWVIGLTVVLPGGDVLDLTRGEVTEADGRFEIVHPNGRHTVVPVPTYTMPEVAKLSAGYYARPGMDLIDLFIGAEGTLGVIVSATLRVVPRPRQTLALVTCAREAQALAVTDALRRAARAAWEGRGPLDVAAVEFIDAASIALLPDEAFQRAAVDRPPDGAVLLLVQMEVAQESHAALGDLARIMELERVDGDPVVALPEDERGAARLLGLREAVPAAVNALVAARKASDPQVEKTACDMVVPYDRLADSLSCYRRAFADRGLSCAIWGHLSDGNLHPNVLPRTADEVRLGREAILEIAGEVMAMGGAPLAEHGVGRSTVKQQLLRTLYGEAGVAQMVAVKQAIDPAWTLAPGVLFPEPAALPRAE